MGIRRIVDRVWARVRAWTGTKVPLDPSDFVATRSDEDTIALSWTDNSDNETGFLIERKTGSGSYSNLTTAAADATSYTDDTAYPGYAYTYQLSAFNLTGSSNTVTSEEVTMPLTAPATVTAMQFTANTINVSWTDSSGYESGWRIQRSNAGAAFAALTNVSAGTTTYQDTTAAVGYNYQYQVATINATSSANSAYTQSVVVTPTYLYGYPAAQSAEPNVAAQWLFDELTGNTFTDEVGEIVLSEDDGRLLVHNVQATGVWAGVSPGVFPTQNDGLRKLTSTPSLNITTDHVVEFICSLPNTASNGYAGCVFYIGNSATYAYNRWYFEGASNFLEWSYKATDATTVSGFKNFSSNLRDNLIHKFRQTGDWDGNVEFFIDGVSLGTAAISTMNEKTVPAEITAIGETYGGGLRWKGSYFEFRITIGNKTNNSGGPGGG